MDKIGKLDRILDEEDRNVVADQVPVAFLRVELDREAPHIAGEVERAFRARHGREPHERGHAFAHPLKYVRAGNVCETVGQLKEAMCTIPACVHHPLGNTLMIEVENFLAKNGSPRAAPAHGHHALACFGRGDGNAV